MSHSAVWKLAALKLLARPGLAAPRARTSGFRLSQAPRRLMHVALRNAEQNHRSSMTAFAIPHLRLENPYSFHSSSLEPLTSKGDLQNLVIPTHYFTSQPKLQNGKGTGGRNHENATEAFSSDHFQVSMYYFASALVGVAFALVFITRLVANNAASAQSKNEDNGDAPIITPEGAIAPASPLPLEDIITEEVRSKFWPVLLSEWKMLLTAIALTFAASLAELLTMRLGGKVLDSTMNRNLDAFMTAAWKLCAAVAMQGFLQFISYTALTQATERVRARLSTMAFASIIYQDKSFFDRHNSAELMNRLSSDVAEIRNVVKNTISLGVKSTTSIVGGMVAAFAKSPSLALLIAAAIGSAVSIGSLYARLLRRLSRASKDANARAVIVANEATSAVTTVQAFVGEDREIERQKKYVDHSVYMSQRFGAALGFFKGISTIGVSGILIGVLLYGGHMVSQGRLTVGDLSSFVVVASSIQSSLGNIAQLVGQLASGRDAVDRVFAIIDSKPTINPKSGIVSIPVTAYTSVPSPTQLQRGTVTLDHVTFAYGNRPDLTVLKDVSLNLEAGKTLSLVGHSGSGKSTISRLILRFYDPVAGTVRVDGMDIRTMDPHWLRSQIGIVEQEPVLFAGTIYENIAYGRPGASRQEIIDAARSANCEVFIKSFPDGFDTVVGERGTQLSGGQKQRIAIARALLKNPRILILDEATSALDASTEVQVQEALNTLMRNRTTLIIAHRLSTIKNSDTIVVLDHGKVVETGNHESLSKANGFYARLVEQQMGHAS